jgi:hypothetical protein
MDCILTGRKVTYEDLSKTIYYKLKIADTEIEIFICRDCVGKIRVTLPPHIMSGLIANKKWTRSFIISNKHVDNYPPPASSQTIVLPDDLETISYPKFPSEKSDHLFLDLYGLQKFDGELVTINLKDEIFWVKNYFKNDYECLYHVDGLKENGLINYHKVEDAYNIAFRITHLGLNKATELLEEGDNSNNCFIAMAFRDETKSSREAIKKALIATSFVPVIIDEEYLPSDKTIPDGILAGIKKSKFCIADFSYHHNGIYFESAYALGMGKPVIYVCEEKEFAKAHFDIKQLQHIIYSTPEELEKKLIDKIEAWIKE